LSSGIIFTNSDNSAIYLLQNNSPELLTESPGCGFGFALSKDGNTIGFKYIDQNGNQVPSLLDLSTKQITKLHSAAEYAGQVSFANDGSFAFTVGNQLIIHSGNNITKYDLGVYSNIAPISPDAKYAAFNDNNDQIYIINLKTGIKEKITDDTCGYFSPNWSPDGTKLLYSSLSGILKVYDLEANKTYFIGSGFSPSWSNDSQSIVFYRKEIKNLELINSDIFISSFNGNSIKQITSTPDQLEKDPSFGNNDSDIIYSTFNSEAIIKANVSYKNYSLTNLKEINLNLKPIELKQIHSLNKVEDIDTLDIPYINQVYDVPDYCTVGYSACAPTSAMMVLAFYKILPTWTIRCSWPYSHYSNYGRYISDSYRFRGVSYTTGAYGYMWTSGYSPYSRMVNFFNYHGFSATRTDAPSYETILNAVNSGKPYVLCVGLTTAGHVIVAHGTASQSHTFIFNDPYGNKNTPGYPSYDGKNVKYDWPGYNNGYKNLNTVYWSVLPKYNQSSFSDTLIDDLDFGNGFYLNTTAPQAMYKWKDLNQGYQGHMWFTYTTDSAKTDTCYAAWTPNLPKDGFYKVYAYIPFSNAEAAIYKINSADGVKTSIINQTQFKNAWADLGKYRFYSGTSGYVRLGDSSSIGGQPIIFDAVKWIYIDSVETAIKDANVSLPNKYTLEQNYPNPFNPTTIINYSIPQTSFVTLKIYDGLGKVVASLINEQKAAGNYEAEFNGSKLSSGIYFYRLNAGNYSETKKMILMK
jgi:hypothetical protein